MKTPDPIIKQYLETPEGSIPDLRVRSRIINFVVLIAIIAVMATFISLAGLISGGIIMVVIMSGYFAFAFVVRNIFIVPSPSKVDIIRDIAQHKREREEQTRSTMAPMKTPTICSAADSLQPPREVPVAAASHEVKPARIFIRRQEASTNAFRSWYVYLDGKPVAKIANGATVSVPTTAAEHLLSFKDFNGVRSSVRINIFMPQAQNTLYTVEVGTTGMALLESRVLSDTEANSLPARQADVSGNLQPPRPFVFNEVLRQKISILVIFYWLFRWLWPSLLPESLRQLSFLSSLIPSAILGLIWTGISFLMSIGGSTLKDNKLHNDDKSR